MKDVLSLLLKKGLNDIPVQKDKVQQDSDKRLKMSDLKHQVH